MECLMIWIFNISILVAVAVPAAYLGVCFAEWLGKDE